MPDREKIIYSIERCISHVPDACRDCAYDAGHPYNECVEMMLKDALELLKEQEAVVRCKDCRKRNSDDCPVYGWMPLKADELDWFCADGEMKDEKNV